MVVSTVCVYWCYIGDMSWVMRIQNHSHYQTSPLDFPLTDITTLFMPSLASRKEQQFGNFVSGHTRINSENLAESEYDVCISLGTSVTVSILCITSIIICVHQTPLHHFSYTKLQGTTSLTPSYKTIYIVTWCKRNSTLNIGLKKTDNYFLQLHFKLEWKFDSKVVFL